MREVINTILYLNRSGCQWDMLPHDLLPKSTVYDYFAAWRDDGAELYFVNANEQMVAVPVTWIGSGTERKPQFGEPEVLFRPRLKYHADRQFDTIDGQTFVLGRVVVQGSVDPLTLLQHWEGDR